MMTSIQLASSERVYITMMATISTSIGTASRERVTVGWFGMQQHDDAPRSDIATKVPSARTPGLDSDKMVKW